MTREILATLSLCATVVFVYMVALWTLSIRIGDPSFVDAGWGFGFVLIATVAFGSTDGDPARSAALVAICCVWGTRLGSYLLWRWRKQGPDRRYQAMLRSAPGNPHMFTLKRVFLLQGALMWVVSLPIQLGLVYPEPRGVTTQAIIGMVLAVIGFGFESIGDAQLVRFKADPNNDGLVLQSGLWRYTRHPNYFGDALVWWGLTMVAVVNVPTAFAVVGPILMTTLLLRYSGVPILERGLTRRRAGYSEYVERTSAFMPRPPRRR